MLYVGGWIAAPERRWMVATFIAAVAFAVATMGSSRLYPGLSASDVTNVRRYQMGLLTVLTAMLLLRETHGVRAGDRPDREIIALAVAGAIFVAGAIAFRPRPRELPTRLHRTIAVLGVLAVVLFLATG